MCEDSYHQLLQNLFLPSFFNIFFIPLTACYAVVILRVNSRGRYMKRIFCAGFAYLAHISLFGQKSSICMFYPYFRHILKFCRTSLHHIFGGAIWVIAYYFGAFPSFSSLFCHFFWGHLGLYVPHTSVCALAKKITEPHFDFFSLVCSIFFL